MIEEECWACNGTGKDDSCPECQGNGWVDDEELGGTKTCPNCNGDTDCWDCDGMGYIEDFSDEEEDEDEEE